MAKDLPYFKFFCSEWNDGDITLEDYIDQGVFINVCSYYWSNGCDVTYSKLIKKFKDCTDSIEVLENSGVLKVEGGDVWINFLDEQLAERKQTSKKNSEAGKASAEKRRLEKIQRQSNQNSTPVEIPLNGKSTIKKRREEKREEEKEEVQEKEQYRAFAHLSLSQDEFDKLNKDYTKQQIDEILDSIENFANNKKYRSLNLTARQWLKKQFPKVEDRPRINPAATNPVN
jgi:hypothetical protein